MKNYFSSILIVLGCAAGLATRAFGQYETPPASAADKEAAYVAAIEKRTEDILVPLALSDSAKSNKVHDVIIAQYRALRARDEAMAAKARESGKEEAAKNEAQKQTRTLHDQFLTSLSGNLTPEQVELVKDKMTYNKVKVTYDAYCAIIPGLTDADKAKILELLKQAREEAIDGGSATEKTAIFQKYKDKINDYLNAHGHDVAKAYQDWNAKQELAQKQKDESATKTNPQRQ
jgi:hypothetical protein